MPTPFIHGRRQNASAAPAPHTVLSSTLYYCLLVALHILVFHSHPSIVVDAFAFSSPGPGLLLVPSITTTKTTSSIRMSASSSPSTSTSTSTSTFAINTKYKIQPKYKSEFLKVLKNIATQESKTTALQYVVGQGYPDDDDENGEKNVFYVHEEYKSQSQYDDVCKTCEQYKTMKQFFDTENPFVEEPTVDMFTLCHDYDGPHSSGQTIAETSSAAKEEEVEVVCLNVELCIHPTLRQEFLECIRQNKSGSDNEPKCLQYTWGENANEENTFHFHERYVGEDGLSAHNDAPHFKVWEEFAGEGEPFRRTPVVQKFRELL